MGSDTVNLIGVFGVCEYFPLIVSVFLAYYEPETLAKSDEGGELLEAYQERMCETVA